MAPGYADEWNGTDRWSAHLRTHLDEVGREERDELQVMKWNGGTTGPAHAETLIHRRTTRPTAVVDPLVVIEIDVDDPMDEDGLERAAVHPYKNMNEGKKSKGQKISEVPKSSHTKCNQSINQNQITQFNQSIETCCSYRLCQESTADKIARRSRHSSPVRRR